MKQGRVADNLFLLLDWVGHVFPSQASCVLELLLVLGVTTEAYPCLRFQPVVHYLSVGTALNLR